MLELVVHDSDLHHTAGLHELYLLIKAFHRQDILQANCVSLITVALDKNRLPSNDYPAESSQIQIHRFYCLNFFMFSNINGCVVISLINCLEEKLRAY